MEFKLSEFKIFASTPP